jgi:hypothetical protein
MFMIQVKRLVFLFGISVLALIASACGASAAENQQTWDNRQAINQNIPIPKLSFSSRRWVLVNYYKQVLDNPRLRTCTMITPRGGSSKDVIGLIETIGPAVNLSNQITSPESSEADSVYPGTNDQTVFVYRNGSAGVTEADTTSVIGDCPPGLKPDTLMQQVLDYQASEAVGAGQVNFLPPAK